jgi:hypothetical protein
MITYFKTRGLLRRSSIDSERYPHEILHVHLSLITSSEQELSSDHTHNNIIHCLTISSPEIRSFKATMSRSRKFRKKTPGNVPAGVVDKQRKYMTVNLSLIVGHIREVKSASFRKGFVLFAGDVCRVGGLRGWSCMSGFAELARGCSSI